MLVASLCLFECDRMSKLSCMGPQDLLKKYAENTKMWGLTQAARDVRTRVLWQTIRWVGHVSSVGCMGGNDGENG